MSRLIEAPHVIGYQDESARCFGADPSKWDLNPSDNDNDLPKTYKYEEVEVKIDAKGNRTIADLRYQEKDIISPSTLSFAPIKS